MPYRDYEQRREYDRGHRDAEFGWGRHHGRSEDYLSGHRDGERARERREAERAEEARSERRASERRQEATDEEVGWREYNDGQQYPEPTIEEMCGPEHTGYGCDRYGTRCYCGKVRWVTEVK